MEKILDFCDYFYNAHHIPIYIYKDEEMIACFPHQPVSCCPDPNLGDFIRGPQTFLCYITPENLFMGYILVEKYHLEILLGPVNALPYTIKLLSQLLRRKRIPKNEHELCIELY